MREANLLFYGSWVSFGCAARYHRTGRHRTARHPAAHQTNQIANYAIIEWPDNAHISDLSPADCWPQFAARYTEAQWPQIRRWHALSEGWETLPYEEFLNRRRALLAEVVWEGFESP